MWNPTLHLCLRSELILLRRAGSVEVAGSAPDAGSPNTIMQEGSRQIKGSKGCKKRNKQKRANLGVVSGYKPGQNEKFSLLAQRHYDSCVQVKHKRKKIRDFYLVAFL